MQSFANSGRQGFCKRTQRPRSRLSTVSGRQNNQGYFGLRIGVSDDTAKRLNDYAGNLAEDLLHEIGGERDNCADFKAKEDDYHITLAKHEDIKLRFRFLGLRTTEVGRIIADIREIIDNFGTIDSQLAIRGVAWYGRVKKDPRTIAFEVDPDSFHESIGEFNREIIDCLAEIGMSDVVTLSNPHISVARYGQVGDNKRLNRAEKKYAISIAENLRISKNLGHIGVGGLVVTDSKGIPITS